MRIERILILGVTGLIGAPVARQLLADGHHVRVLVRDPDRARARLGPELEYMPGSVTDGAAVNRAVRGIDAAHVSLGVEDPAQLDAVEHHGTASVAAAAARHGLERISYLTGSLVHEEYGPKIPEHRAKLAAEQAIQESGVPYTFFRPTYFTNTLPRHVQGPLLVALGRQRRALHPVCAEDFAVQVAHAFATPAAANRDFYIHGPEPLTLHQALATYRQIVAPDKRLVTIPLPILTTIDRFFMGRKLEPNLQIMRLLARIGERGDATAATDLLGAPTTTVLAWCHTQSHDGVRGARSPPTKRLLRGSRRAGSAGGCTVAGCHLLVGGLVGLGVFDSVAVLARKQPSWISRPKGADMTLAITLTIILAAIVVTAIVGRRRGDDNFARQHRGHHRVKAHTVPARVSDRARTGAIAHLAGRTAG